MVQEDLVWTRDTHGIYWLGLVEGPWEYRDTPENCDADIANVRPARLIEVGTIARVPGKVIASMRSRRTVQKVEGQDIKIYSRWLFAKLSGEMTPSLPGARDVFEFLSDQDCEDIVFVFLQRHGWVVFPARRQADTMAYEYVLHATDDGREATVQVKTGQTPGDFHTLPGGRQAFVFQPNGAYQGRQPEHVQVIGRDEILAFMRENRPLLPDIVKDWMDIVGA